MSRVPEDPTGPAPDWRPVEYEDEELLAYLEPDQLAAHAASPVPPAVLAHRTRVMLWALRIFVIVVGAMVIYTFVYQTAHPGH